MQSFIRIQGMLMLHRQPVVIRNILSCAAVWQPLIPSCQLMTSTSPAMKKTKLIITFTHKLQPTLCPAVFTRGLQTGSPPSLCELAKKADRTFSHGETLCKSKTSGEICRALLAYKLSSWPWFVRNNQRLMSIGVRLLGKRLFVRLMKSTMYSQFVAGEDYKKCEPIVKRNYAHGVSTILHYGAESDLDSFELTDEKFDENADNFRSGVLGVRDATNRTGFVGIKVTGLGPVEVLASACTIIRLREEIFERLQGSSSSPEWALSLSDLTDEREKALFSELSKAYKKQSLSLFEWSDATIRTDHIEGLTLVEKDRDALRKMVARVESIAQCAHENGVVMILDAEQTYYQPAINRLVAQQLMRKFNRGGGVTVWNTHQGYLKETNGILRRHLAFSEQEGFGIGVRCVRGAYLEQEREVALKEGYDDPTQPTYEETTASYFRNVDMTLEAICKRSDVFLMIASHDEDTVKSGLNRLSKLPSEIQRERVKFGQVLGMSDHLTYSLGNSGLQILKATPFGPVPEVLKYLGRRAIENSGLFRKTGKERKILKAELKRRWGLKQRRAEAS